MNNHHFVADSLFDCMAKHAFFGIHMCAKDKCLHQFGQEYHSPADPFQPKWTLPRTPIEDRTKNKYKVD